MFYCLRQNDILSNSPEKEKVFNVMQDSSDEIGIRDEERKNLKPAFFSASFFAPESLHTLSIEYKNRIKDL